MSKKGVDVEALLLRLVREGGDSQMTLAEATALIASRTKKPAEAMRATRNRVRMQFLASLARDGDATEGGLECLPNGKFQTDEIRRWINEAYGKGLFPELPRKGRVMEIAAESTVGFRTTASLKVLPNNLTTCLERVRELENEIAQMKSDAAKADAARRAKLAANFKGK